MAGSLRQAATLLTVVLVAFFALAATAGDKGAGTEHRQWVDGPKVAPVSPPVYDITEQE